MKFRRFHILLLPASLALFSTGCDKDLQMRVDRLEAELREVRSDTRDEVAGLGDRVAAAELKVEGGLAKDLTGRVSAVEDSLRLLQQAQATADKMAYLRPHLNGHVPLPTDHGTFLVRIEGLDLNLEKNGYDVHVNIGNPFALAVQQFTLRGDYGGGVPTLEEGQEYSIYNKKIEEWQKTLKPFEASFTKTLKPYQWTPFDLHLPAESRDEIELIRFTMSIENAYLENQLSGKSGEGDFAHLRVDSKGASVIKTDYGAFLIVVKQAEKDQNGTRLNIEIGNPYGFTISQCRLVGDFGTDIPVRQDNEAPEVFSARMQTWTRSLQPFEAIVTSKLSAFRWNRASFVVPGTLENTKFLRCQLRVEMVTLPSAGG